VGIRSGRRLYRVVVDTPAGPLEATSLRLYEQFQALHG